MNLPYHRTNFGLSANWNFFATSRGKSSCDGLGGAIKRKLVHRSLAQLYQNQILTAKNAFNFRKTAMRNIFFYFLSKENISKVCQVLTERYVQGHTIPGTRIYHVFSSGAIVNIKFNITAEDDWYAGCYKFFDSQQQNIMVNVGDYIAVKFDNSWWIGIILEAAPKDELLVKFMHPSGLWQTFYWPKHDDILHVPKADVLSQISTPNISRSTCVYQITNEEFKFLSKIDLYRIYSPIGRTTV